MAFGLRSFVVVATVAATLLAGLVVPAAGTASAESITVIRPGNTDPETRIDVNGSLVAITYVEDGAQASAVFFAGEAARYQRAGTDPAGRPYGLFLSHDLDGRPAFIVLDLTWLTAEDRQGFVDLFVVGPGSTAGRGASGTHESVQLLLHPQTDGTFAAREYRELAKGSTVNNTDWGIHEAYTTRDDSINARVGNVPDDDEALSKGDRFDQKGRRIDDD